MSSLDLYNRQVMAREERRWLEPDDPYEDDDEDEVYEDEEDDGEDHKLYEYVFIATDYDDKKIEIRRVGYIDYPGLVLDQYKNFKKVEVYRDNELIEIIGNGGKNGH